MAVTIRSLNVHGFGKCRDFVESTLNDNTPQFLLLQESWHLSNNISCLNVNDAFMFKETSGLDETSRILSGRESSFLLYNKGLFWYFRNRSTLKNVNVS